MPKRGGFGGASAVIGRHIPHELWTLYGLRLTKSNARFVQRSILFAYHIAFTGHPALTPLIQGRKPSENREKRKGVEVWNSANKRGNKL
ncbi:hypothetical protein F9C07_5947 [Aspergillus flavus]|uniref:Uncharacterized protein n=1 Tax=Aspergillus flavus (strain ATCC 200026 / FGSC A1120 / IAM 13836 / NRRL 3357 / JCM 12722 / SRRC 167) TaxID=332952 RepID=A0A7U2R0Z9_ASPFN|nr:hypothetical protein F9C07_5947 [Aspergillus flavus]